MRFYTTLQLGPNREVDQFGFTIFKNVSIARAGEQVYGPGETRIEPGPDGLVIVSRSPEEVFRPETLASFNGVPLTIDHPDADVTPDNWKELAHGVFMDARRGAGEFKDHILVDLKVWSREALAVIDAGQRELSAGYDADYYQTGRGRGEQRNIIANHGASVRAGRCGPSCAIRDHKHSEGDTHMCATPNKEKSVLDKILKLVRDEKPEEDETKKKTEDEDEEEEEERKEKEREARDKARDAKIDLALDSIAKLTKHVAARDKARDEEVEAEKKKAEDEEAEAEKKKAADAKAKDDDDDDDDDDAIADEAPEGKEEEAKKAKDSALFVSSFESVKASAEIIAPGVKLTTFDAAAKPSKTVKDCICALRRRALAQGMLDQRTRVLIDTVRGRATDASAITRMKTGEVRALFNAVARMKAADNNSALFAAASATAHKQNDSGMNSAERYAEAAKAKWHR